VHTIMLRRVFVGITGFEPISSATCALIFSPSKLNPKICFYASLLNISK